MPPARNTKATAAATTKPKFSISALKSENDRTPFVFEHGGRDWSMVHSQDLDVWQLNNLVEAASGTTNTDAVAAMFRAALGDQWAEFSKIPLAAWQLNELAGAYSEHCGISMGES